MPALEAALKARDWMRALESVPWDELAGLEHPMSAELEAVLVRAAKAAAATKTWADLHAPLFDVTNPEAVAWIKAHAAEMINKAILPNSKAAIREIILRSFQEGIPPLEAARMIREYIGLLPGHAAAVDKYYRSRLNKGYNAAQAQHSADAYARRLINLRARTIARHETLTASNRGQYELWQQARAAGYLPDDQFERWWITTPDDRACKLCIPMHHKRAPINGTWELPGGRRVEIPQNSHIQCRCGQGIVRKEKTV